MERIRAKAKVENFRFRDFRHGLATRLLRKTRNLKTVSRHQLRRCRDHRYAHVIDEEVAEAHELNTEQPPELRPYLPHRKKINFSEKQ